MIPIEIDWDHDGVHVRAYERDPTTFRRCLRLGCHTVLSIYNGQMYCWVHRDGSPG